MFNTLSTHLHKIVKHLTGRGRLTAKNIEETLKQIRVALIEADVALPVADAFIERIQPKAIGQAVMGSLEPGQILIKFVHDELVTLMGTACEPLNLNAEPPIVLLLVGQQGSGKTTMTAKLARWLKYRLKKSVLVASTDIYRPAAIEQLAILAKQIEVPCFPSDATDSVTNIGLAAIQMAKNTLTDVLLIDTAGRTHTDSHLMTEIKALHEVTHPIETLFVIDSMAGQDAIHVAKTFHTVLPLTGVLLTKTEGDARGGVALSVRYLTQLPIKFIGDGEKVEALEPFYPDRIASRILGMGDIVSVVEKVQQELDQQETAQLVKKLKKNKSFDFNDLLVQFEQLNHLGGLSSLSEKLGGGLQQIQGKMSDKKVMMNKAIIQSMTLKERRYPDHIKHSHKKRIAAGSGTSIQAVNQLLKQFDTMRKLFKKIAKVGKFPDWMQKMMHAIGAS